MGLSGERFEPRLGNQLLMSVHTMGPRSSKAAVCDTTCTRSVLIHVCM